jgi:predicted mannosyl-3-phosphoglycerate phosphatase (HAD superfamily)
MSPLVPTTLVFAGIDEVPLGIDEGHRRLPALLATLAAERIMLVFCSRRTRAEIEGFRQSVGVFHPFICEDGAAAFVPSRYFESPLHNARAVGGYEAIEFGARYDDVAAAVRRHADQLRIAVRGFADMSIEQVARECGLSLLTARLAKLREYGEPFRLLEPNHVAQARLVRTLASAGISCLPHGSFLHAVSVDGPTSAIAVLRSLYGATFGRVFTVTTGIVPPPAAATRIDADLGATVGDYAGGGETLAWLENIVERVRATRAGRAPASLQVGA